MKKTSRRTGASRKRSPRPRASTRRALLPHEAALAAFARIAKRLGVRWYVFGAQAVNLHGFPRATADLDLTIDLGALPTGAFLAELSKAGFEPQFSDPAFVAATRVVPVVHRGSLLPIDLVLAGPGLEQTFLDEAEPHELAGCEIPVLSIEHLIVTKVLAGRSRDKDDVRELLAGRPALDHTKIDVLLGLVEKALDQSDLRPLYRQLRAEATNKRKPQRR